MLAVSAPAISRNQPETPAANAASAAADAEIAARRSRLDAAQRGLETLSADFRERIEHPLLAEPVVREGRLWWRSPAALRWDVALPRPARYTLADGRYVGYFADEGRAETRRVGKRQERIARGLTLGRALDELERTYRIELPPQLPEGASEMMVLRPRARRARRRIERVEIVFSGEPPLPLSLAIFGAEGERRTIDFTDVRANEPLPADLFDPALPEGTPVEPGFSWLTTPLTPEE